MSTLFGIQKLSKSFGAPVFKGLSFSLHEGERVGLIGPNGSGKSTLLKMLYGLEEPDSGCITFRQGLRLGYASQEPEFASLPLEEILLQQVGKETCEAQTRARILLSKAGFVDSLQNASCLSGGWKKRLDIVRALMLEPDLLLLDEPTNHLDLEGILWLEKFLLREQKSYIVVSHDRYFLENISEKVIELNRCYPDGVFISEGSLSDYIEKKEAFLEAQKSQERSLRSIMQGEEEWLKRSPKARTTKSTARIKRAYMLQDELSGVRMRNRQQSVQVAFSASERETQKLLVAKNLAKSYNGRLLFKGADLVLSPGSRLGIMGKNGTGKTTLLKILAGQIAQDLGTIKVADDLRLVYFDQHREKVAPDITLQEALSPHGEYVNFQGQSIHVNGWAKKFLFSPERLSLPVKCLSGGERARILLAKLMLEPADILFLDEPTNDLDIETLEVIEESLKSFAGAIVLISHDRCLVDRVCTQILGLGDPHEPCLFADYEQWEKATFTRQEKRIEEKRSQEPPKPVTAAPQSASKHASKHASKPAVKKLSYHKQKELSGMEATIEALEKRLGMLQEQESSIASNPKEAFDYYRNVSGMQTDLERHYARWQELLDQA